MFFGLITIAVGLFLIFVSYLLMKLGSFFLSKAEKSGDPKKKPDILGQIFPFPRYESVIFTFVSVLIFVFGLLIALYGFVLMTGLIDIS